MGAKAAVIGDAALWIGVLTGPIVFAIDETVGYAVANTRCGQPWAMALLHLMTAGSLIAIAAAAVAAAAAPRPNERARFMGHLGMLTSALFVILVAAMEIPRLLLHVCH